MIAMVTTEVKRMGHMPHPPLWNAVEIAVSMNSPPTGAGLFGGGRPLCKRAATTQPTMIVHGYYVGAFVIAVASWDAPRQKAAVARVAQCGGTYSRMWC